MNIDVQLLLRYGHRCEKYHIPDIHCLSSHIAQPFTIQAGRVSENQTRSVVRDAYPTTAKNSSFVSGSKEISVRRFRSK